MKKLLCSILCSALFIGSLNLTGCSNSNTTNNTLTLFNYGDYIDRDLITQFEEETGIDVKYEEAATPEELYTKFCSGAVQYDLLCTSEYMISRMIKEDRLEKIDFSQLEYADNISQQYWDFSTYFDPTNEYAMPYYLGTLGLLYDKTKVDGPVDSWDVIFSKKEQEKHKNQIIMMNNQRDVYMIALKYLGYSLNTSDEEEILEAHELLMNQKPYVQAYLVDESRDEMVAGNASIAVIYSGDAILAKEYNENLEYVIPKEGTNLWIDSWVMPKDCPNKEAAMKFLDFICREDVATQNFEYVWYTTPNDAVLKNIDEETLSNETIFPTAESLEPCEICTQIDPEVVQLYTNLWKQLKSE